MRYLPRRSIALFACMAWIMTGVLFADETEKETKKEEVKMQTTCPVMGGEINKSLYVDHEGKRIYVCCPGCLTPLKKDPEKYIKQMEEKGITLYKTPEAKKDESKKEDGKKKTSETSE